MKKRYLIIALFVFMLVGCSEQKVNENTIEPIFLNYEEDQLLGAAIGNLSFLYDYRLEQGKFLTVWLERYEYGQLMERTGGVTEEIYSENEKGQLLVYLLDKPEWENFYVRTAIISESGHIRSDSVIPAPDERFGFGGGGSIIAEQVKVSENMVLGQYLFTDGEQFGVGSSDLYNEPEQFIEKRKEVPILYVVRASVTDELPNFEYEVTHKETAKTEDTIQNEENDYYLSVIKDLISNYSEEEMVQFAKSQVVYELTVNDEKVPANGEMTVPAGEIQILLAEMRGLASEFLSDEWIEKGTLSGDYINHIQGFDTTNWTLDGRDGTVNTALGYKRSDVEDGEIITFNISDELMERLGLTTNTIRIEVHKNR